MISPLRTIYRRYRVLIKIVALSFIVSYAVIWLIESTKRGVLSGRMARRRFQVQMRTDKSLAEQNYAYASLLCDDVMSEATKVLIHSLKSKTNHPFILLVLPQVKQTEDFVKLGAKLQVISELEYPFKVNQEKVAINKMCRYSKLHIWKFIQYKKIIFIDVDCLIVQVLFANSLVSLSFFRVWIRLFYGRNFRLFGTPVTLSIQVFLSLNPRFLHMTI